MEELLSRITINPAICHGKPTIRGLRYTVDFILGLLSSGMSNEEILANYPDLDSDDLRAVFAYAARLSPIKRVEVHAAAVEHLHRRLADKPRFPQSSTELIDEDRQR